MKENRSNFTSLKVTGELTPGIYELVCLPTGERYVGCSTVCTLHRAKQHRRTLRLGVCKNVRLQAAFDKYGESAFELVEFTELTGLLVKAEAELIAKWRKKGLAFNEQGSTEQRALISARVTDQHKAGRFGRVTRRSK